MIQNWNLFLQILWALCQNKPLCSLTFPSWQRLNMWPSGSSVYTFVYWELIYLFCGVEENPKLKKALLAFGNLMKVGHQRFQGMQLATGLSMYLQGCKEDIFNFSNKSKGCVCHITQLYDILIRRHVDWRRSHLSRYTYATANTLFRS